MSVLTTCILRTMSVPSAQGFIISSGTRVAEPGAFAEATSGLTTLPLQSPMTYF